MTIYDYTVKNGAGEDVPLAQFKGHILLIANTACAWLFTPQFQGLESLYNEYKQHNFTVLAFPCNQFGNQDPGTNEEIQTFAHTNYHTTFPVMEKVEVNGSNESPLFTFLKQASKRGKIRWNFTKFLLDRNGTVIKRYAPFVRPEKIKKDIEKLLNTE